MDDAVRFPFGRNWQSFVQAVDADAIAQAEHGLKRLFPDLRLKSFFDIGCGSGLSLLAASRLGATPVKGLDFDAQSVAASRQLLDAFGKPATVEQRSVFDLGPKDGTFDVVYSWGVLHHTGDMWTALDHARAMVSPGGHLAIAIYSKTPLCRFWAIEKRFYTSAPTIVQTMIRAAFKTVFLAGILATGRNPIRYVREYKSERGMDWHHDIHDWLGGYPYQSARPEEIESYLGRNGFLIVHRNVRKAALAGLLGTPCSEYVARRDAVG